MHVSGSCSAPHPSSSTPLCPALWVAENHILLCPLALCEARPVGGMMSLLLGVGENLKLQPEGRTIARVKQTEGRSLLQPYWFPLVGSFFQAPEVWVPTPWGNASLFPSFCRPRCGAASCRHPNLVLPSCLSDPLIPLLLIIPCTTLPLLKLLFTFVSVFLIGPRWI